MAELRWKEGINLAAVTGYTETKEEPVREHFKMILLLSFYLLICTPNYVDLLTFIMLICLPFLYSWVIFWYTFSIRHISKFCTSMASGFALNNARELRQHTSLYLLVLCLFVFYFYLTGSLQRTDTQETNKVFWIWIYMIQVRTKVFKCRSREGLMSSCKEFIKRAVVMFRRRERLMLMQSEVSHRSCVDSGCENNTGEYKNMCQKIISRSFEQKARPVSQVS